MENSKKVVLAAVTLLAAGSASAAGEAVAAIGAIGTEAASIIAAVWPVLTAVTVAFIGMKLFKRAAGKST